MGIETAIMAAGVAASAASAASSMKKKSGAGGSATGTTVSTPWSAQQPYLKEGFKWAKDEMGDMIGTGGYQGPWTAPMTPAQVNNLKATYAGNTGSAANADLMNTAGKSLLSDPRLSQMTGDIWNQGSKDLTGETIARAGQYADNPYLQSQIDSTIKDVEKGFSRDLGQLNSAASRTGNINSTRAGVTESLLRDDAMDRAAGVSANMRGNAYNSGLNMGAAQLQNQFGNMVAGAGLEQQRLNTGGNLLGAGQSYFNQAQNAAGSAADRFQAQRQAEFDNMQNQSGYQDNRLLDLISKYQSIVGGAQYGSTVNSYAPKPSALQTALGGLTTAGGLIGQFGGLLGGGNSFTTGFGSGGGLGFGNPGSFVGGGAFPNMSFFG